MTVSTLHPEYTADRLAEWKLMRDAYEGESAVKRAGELYLPKPDGWLGLSDAGAAMYAAYQKRARFPEITSNAIRGMVGVLHSQDWQIDIPDVLSYIFERATKDGLPIESFSKRITTELLLTGRYSVLAEASQEGGDPYLAGYRAESLINWDEERDFYVFQENVNRRDGFTWSTVTQARALELEDGRYVQRVYEDGGMTAEYQPSGRGGRPLDFIPVAIGGAMDMDLKPDTPPLIGVARAAVSHYQINADYRLALFMAYQDTLVIHNATEAPKAVGAGTMIALQSASEGKDTRAEYISPSGTAIEAHERAMDREQQSATRSGAQMFDNTPRGQESGEARRLRFSAETATIQSIANSSAAILEKSLRNVARLSGIETVDDIVVKPPQNLLDGQLDAQAIGALVAAWEAGAFGYETLYENLQRGRIASMERTAEDEQALIDEGLPSEPVI